MQNLEHQLYIAVNNVNNTIMYHSQKSHILITITFENLNQKIPRIVSWWWCIVNHEIIYDAIHVPQLLASSTFSVAATFNFGENNQIWTKSKISSKFFFSCPRNLLSLGSFLYNKHICSIQFYAIENWDEPSMLGY